MLIVATLFTLVPGRGGEPIISPHLKALRPFLKKGDFAPGSWGQQLVDELAPADINVEKIAYSAFSCLAARMGAAKCGIEQLYFTGIVTNGGVASTVRDAHVREFHCTVIADGCAAFSREVHDAAIEGAAACRESDHGRGCDARLRRAIVRGMMFRFPLALLASPASRLGRIRRRAGLPAGLAHRPCRRRPA